jgi:hypothetical protein
VRIVGRHPELLAQGVPVHAQQSGGPGYVVIRYLESGLNKDVLYVREDRGIYWSPSSTLDNSIFSAILSSLISSNEYKSLIFGPIIVAHRVLMQGFLY